MRIDFTALIITVVVSMMLSTGAVLAALIAFNPDLLTPNAVAPSGEPSGSSMSARDLSKLDDRDAELQEQLTTLTLALESLNQRLASVENTGGAPMAARVDAPVMPELPENATAEEYMAALQNHLAAITARVAELEARQATVENNVTDLDTDFGGRVLSEIEAERARQAAEEEARRQEQLAEWRKQQEEYVQTVYDERLDEMTGELAMNGGQIDAVRDAFNMRKTGIMAMRDPDVPEDQRKSWEAVNTEFDQEIQRILSPQQYQMYKDKGLHEFNGRRNNNNRQGGNGQGGSGGG